MVVQDGKNPIEEEVQVDFDFADIREFDDRGVRFLITQLMGPDATLVAPHTIAQTVCQQPWGTVVRIADPDEPMGDEEEDPVAMVSVIPMDPIASYIEERTNAKMGRSDVGWLILERLLNMPPQVVPPMLKMLHNELKDSPFKTLAMFTKVFQWTSEDNDEATFKKQKRECQYFHMEDEFLEKHAIQKVDFTFKCPSAVPDSRRLFGNDGIDPFRRLLFIPTEKLADIVADMESQ
jgi:protein BCP1